MFFGEQEHSMDEKGRVSVPSKFREDLSEEFYITPGLNNCLTLYPEGEFNKVYKSIQELPATDPKVLMFTRKFNALVTKCTLDKLGRVTISNTQKEHAKISKEIIFLGMSNRIELWSKELWDNMNSTDYNYEELAQELSYMGLKLN